VPPPILDRARADAKRIKLNPSEHPVAADGVVVVLSGPAAKH